MRELHGGARLYPDTDSQAIINSEKDINVIKKALPEYPWITIKNLSDTFKIEERAVKDLIFSEKLNLFNDLVKISPENAQLIITSLLETTIALRRDGKNIENISEKDYKDIFTLIKKKEIGKEAVEEFMIMKANNPELSINQIKQELNIEKISEDELQILIRKIVEENISIIKEKEMRAMAPLMGIVMKEVRGKIDGKIVSNELKNVLENKLKEWK